MAIPCVGRWHEVSRVTSPVPAIHRLYSPIPLPPPLLVAPRLRRRFLGFVVFSLSPFGLGLIRVMLMISLSLDLWQVQWI